MSKLLYNLGVRSFHLVLRLISPFHRKAQLFIDGRKARHWQDVPKVKHEGEKRVWMHAASLGEFEQGRPILERLRKDYPDLYILLTFFSPSGFEVRKEYSEVDCVSYLMLDSSKSASEFLDWVQPDLLLMIKYEFWLNHLQAAFDRNIPVLYISAIFRPDHVYFNKGKGLYFDYFGQVDHFLVQDQQSQDLLLEHGIDQVSIAGDTRFDRVLDIARKSNHIPQIDAFITNEPVMVMGSIWLDDLDRTIAFIEHKLDTMKFILAPHNIEENDLRKIEDKLASTIRFSQLGSEPSKARILLIDNMGMLSSLYRYARYAYVGGAFHGAIHNTLEAAVYGIPVLFGRHHRNEKFNEVKGLIESGGGFDFQTREEFTGIIDHLDKNPDAYKRACEEAKSFTYSNAGATERVMKYIHTYIT